MTDSHGPVFIGGPDRCGKTLVAAIVGSHPRIAISAVGSNLWPLFYRQYGELSHDANAERCISALLRYKHVRFMEPDADALRREFWSGERSYARLFALLQEHHARRLGKVRWGDQTGLVERYADDIFRAYPDVRFIHMVRDPRDRYEASLQMWPEGRLRAGGAAGRWLLSTELAARNARRYRGRYLVLRYEALVTEPESTAQLLCEFLGERYEPSILELRGMPGYRAKLEASSRSDPAAAHGLFSRAFIGAYRGRIPPGELAFMQDVARRRMAEHGYVADPVEMDGGQRWRYRLAGRPLNLVRMGVWRIREAAAYRFPRLLGRRPRAGMVV